MTNAKKEFLSAIEGSKVICAYIDYQEFKWNDEGETKSLKVSLKKGYSKEDFQSFIEKLDFTYDDGYGTQELFGTIWLENNHWLSRLEYDGSEYWQYNCCPKIPNDLKLYYIELELILLYITKTNLINSYQNEKIY